MWNMPNCVGAIDGKHIAMKCPKNSGSNFFNYKKFFSIVLMAACDAKYTFIAASGGAYGSESDGGIFRNSEFGEALLMGRLPLPANKPLPNNSNMEPFPHYFVGDAAFPLGNNLMKPISPPRSGVIMPLEDTIFNYRLSRARRTIENTFGILAARWRILNTTLEFMPGNSETIVLACIVLHNFIMMHDLDRWYCPRTYVDRDGPDNTTALGDWRNEIGASSSMRDFNSHSRRSSRRALELRDMLRNYFANEGAVPFQPN